MALTISKIADSGKVDFKEGSVFQFAIASNFNISTDGEKIYFSQKAVADNTDFALKVTDIDLVASGITNGSINSIAEQIKTTFFPDASAGGSGGGGGSVADGSITTSKLADDSVTFGKFQNIATQTFLGRNSSGTGNVEQINVFLARAMLLINMISEYGNPSTTTYERSYIYGDLQNPISGNIDIQEAGTIQGSYSIFIHQSATRPTFSATQITAFLNPEGIDGYVLNAINFILVYPIIKQDDTVGHLVYIHPIVLPNAAPNLGNSIERIECEVMEGNGVNSGGTLIYSDVMKIPAMRFSCNAIGDAGAKARYMIAAGSSGFNPSTSGSWAYEEKVVFGQLSTAAERFIYASPLAGSALTDPTADGNGLQFFYAQNINAGKLALKYRAIYLDLGITPIINTEYKLSMKYNAETDILRVYVDNNEAGVINQATTNATAASRIPNATLSMRAMVYKTAHSAVTNTVDISKRILEIYK